MGDMIETAVYIADEIESKHLKLNKRIKSNNNRYVCI